MELGSVGLDWVGLRRPPWGGWGGYRRVGLAWLGLAWVGLGRVGSDRVG